MKKILNKGFTLIETLMAIFVFTLLSGAISGLVLYAYRSYRYQWQQALAISEARKGIRTMIKEIREAKIGDDGSYPLAYADDNEIIFYSDVDQDQATEKVHYYLGSGGNHSNSQTCNSSVKGGECSVSFSSFTTNNVTSATLVVSTEGDLGWNKEYVDIYADDVYLGKICKNGCSDCSGSWQGTSTFDVTNFATDKSIQLRAVASNKVDPFCDWQQPNHSFLVKFDFSWEEDSVSSAGELKKEVTDPIGSPVTYLPENSSTKIISRYIRNGPSIFQYFDKNGNQITLYPARLKDTRVMQVLLQVDVDPNNFPPPFELSSKVYLRNLDSIEENYYGQ